MAHKTLVPKQILIFLSLAILLVVARIVLFGNWSLMYLLWNIFLAILPFVVSSTLLWYSRKSRLVTPLFIAGTIIWLILLPNAPYIITDLIHVGYGNPAQVFYNTVLLFSCALAGVTLALYSLSHMDEVFTIRYGKRTASALLIGNMFLASFGVSIGRFMRFNSWDIFTNTGTFLRNILNIFIHPQLYVHVYIVTCTFFLFIFMLYSAWNYDNRK